MTVLLPARHVKGEDVQAGGGGCQALAVKTVLVNQQTHRHYALMSRESAESAHS